MLVKKNANSLFSQYFSLLRNNDFASVVAHLFVNGTKLKILSEVKPLLICKLRMQKTFLSRKSENDYLFCASLCQ
jgi:hypothetical protein